MTLVRRSRPLALGMLVLLIRHGLTDTTGKRLTGRTPGIHLNEAGIRQAEELAQRLSRSRIDVIYSSPLERCAETAQPLAGGRGLQPKWDEGLLEVDYGDWSGRPLKELAKLPLWQRLRASPAEVHRVLEVPLRTLLDPRNLRTELWDHEGASRIIYFYTVGADVVWGATARVITQFLRRVFPAVIPPDGDLPAARRRE